MIEKEQPVEDHMRQAMNDIGHIIGRVIKDSGERYGFALLVFPMGDNQPHDRMNYISNAQREDMLTAMKEFIARAEGRYEENFTKRKS